MHKLKIQYCFLFLIGFAFFSCPKQNQSNDLENIIISLVKAFKENDEPALNAFISKEKGLITIFRLGIFNQYGKIDSIDFEGEKWQYSSGFDFSTDFELSFDSLPTYDCGTEEWSKIGIYCDTTRTDHLLSKTAKSLNKYMDTNISEKEIQSFEKLEDNSHRIVLSDNKEGGLIFYLTLIDEKWYLTIIDKVTYDCSA